MKRALAILALLACGLVHAQTRLPLDFTATQPCEVDETCNPAEYPGALLSRDTGRFLYCDKPTKKCKLVPLVADVDVSALNTVTVCNVKNHGATGDGSTDDTAAIAATITACSATVGGVVYFPAGEYIVAPNASSWEAIFELTRGIPFVGDGRGLSTIKVKDSGGKFWSIFGGTTTPGVTSTTDLSGLAFYRLTFDFNSTNNPRDQSPFAATNNHDDYRNGIYVTGADNSHVYVQDCEFKDASSVWAVFAVGTGSDVSITDNTVTDWGGDAGLEGTNTSGTSTTVLTDSGASWQTNKLVGAQAVNVTDWSVCSITSNDATTATCSGGLQFGQDNQWQPSDAYYISIDSSVFYHSMDGGHVNVSGNHIEASYVNAPAGRSGIETHSSESTVTDNTVKNFSSCMQITGVEPGDTTGLVVTGNVCDQVSSGMVLWSQKFGAHTTGYGLDGAIISDNTINLVSRSTAPGGGLSRRGIALTNSASNDLPTRNLKIINNTITHPVESSAVSSLSSDHYAIGYRETTTGVVHEGMKIEGNIIEGFPFNGIRASDGGYRNLSIKNNHLTNTGSTLTSPSGSTRAPLFVYGTELCETADISGNTFYDNVATTRIPYFAYLGADVTCHGMRFTKNPMKVDGTGGSWQHLFLQTASAGSGTPFVDLDVPNFVSGTLSALGDVAIGSQVTDSVQRKVWREGSNRLYLSTREFYAQDYGAKCDDSTNDATAIQAAIDAADDVNGVVILPPGTCRFGSTLTITNRVTLQGAGRGDSSAGAAHAGTILRKTADVIGIKISDGAHYTVVRNLDLYSTGLSCSTNAPGIESGQTATPGADKVTLENLFITGQCGSGIDIRSGNLGRVENVESFNNGNGGTFDGFTCDSDAAGVNVNGWVFTNVVARTNTGHGIEVDQCPLLTIQGAYLASNTVDGIHCNRSAQHYSGLYVDINTGTDLNITGNCFDSFIEAWVTGTPPDVTIGAGALASDTIFINGGIRALNAEGATYDGIEGRFAFDDPTSADKVWTFPNRTGTVSLSGDTFTGDVTGTLQTTGATPLTVANNAVTYAKMQDVSATDRVLCRDTSGAGDTEECTSSAVMDMIGTTRGSILYRGASGWAILAPGTATHVLTSNGAGADPSYQAPTGGGAEVNDLEATDPPTVEDDEVYVGTGTGAGTFVALQNCNDTTGKLDWNGSAFVCNTDQTGGGGAALTVEEADSSPTDNAVTVIQFDQADGYVVTDEGTGLIQIDHANPADCGASTWATTIAANGDLTCSAISGGAGITDATVAEADLASEDYGSFTCGGSADDCLLDTDSVTATAIAAGAVGTSEAAALDAGDTTTGRFGVARLPETCKTFVIENMAADDDGLFVPLDLPYAVTLTNAWCKCKGTCTTLADISFHQIPSDGTGTPANVDDPGTDEWVDCTAHTANQDVEALGADNTVPAYDGIYMDVDNAVSPETDSYSITICWTND